MHSFKVLALGLSAALLVACGGGGNGDQSTKVSITSVKVMGDSLSDGGTFDKLTDASGFGRIFSVQGSDVKIWTELVAATFGVNTLCSYFTATGTDTPTGITRNVGCSNYAIGGARINNALQPLGNSSPSAVGEQLSIAATSETNSPVTYGPRDLFLIDGGGNDAADLAEAYLFATFGLTGGFDTLLNTLVPTRDKTANMSTQGTVYMTALANNFYDSIQASVLDKGASHVAIVNLPGITVTPRFLATLDFAASVAEGAKPGTGPAARAAADTQIKNWISVFNAQLKTRAAGNKSVIVVDLNTEMDNQVKNPAQYGLTNVTTPACPATGTGVDATYNFATCTTAALSAMTPPAGATGGANWWKTYAFSDGFHPTPYGHKLLAQLVNKELVLAGWL